MKKRLLALTLVLCMSLTAFLLTSCGNDNIDETTERTIGLSDVHYTKITINVPPDKSYIGTHRAPECVGYSPSNHDELIGLLTDHIEFLEHCEFDVITISFRGIGKEKLLSSSYLSDYKITFTSSSNDSNYAVIFVSIEDVTADMDGFAIAMEQLTRDTEISSITFPPIVPLPDPMSDNG